MNDLTVEQIITIHKGIMTSDGDDALILSEANLHQLVFRANLIPQQFKRAAFVLYSIAAYPPFCDGNKRTARIIAGQILLEEGCHFIPEEDNRIFVLLHGVAAYEVEPEDIEDWLHKHTKK
jgi:death-on-curing family protein